MDSHSLTAIRQRLNALVTTPERYLDFMCFYNQAVDIVDRGYDDGRKLEDLSDDELADLHTLRSLLDVLEAHVGRIGRALPRNKSATCKDRVFCLCDMDSLGLALVLHKHKLPPVPLGDEDADIILDGCLLLADELNMGCYMDLGTSPRFWSRFCRFMALILEALCDNEECATQEGNPVDNTELHSQNSKVDQVD